MFGMTLNAGMGWEPSELANDGVMMISTLAGIRSTDGSPKALALDVYKRQSYDVAFFPARGDQNEGTFAFEGILHKAAFMVRQCVRFICRGVVGVQQGRNSNT